MKEIQREAFITSKKTVKNEIHALENLVPGRSKMLSKVSLAAVVQNKTNKNGRFTKAAVKKVQLFG